MAEAAGHLPHEVREVRGPGPITITMPTDDELAVRVLDEDGAPIADASISIYAPNIGIDAIRALELAESFVDQAPIAQMFAKQGLDHAWDHSFAQALDLEGQSQAICFTTDDLTEGIAAFLEKRSAEFEGR